MDDKAFVGRHDNWQYLDGLQGSRWASATADYRAHEPSHQVPPANIYTGPGETLNRHSFYTNPVLPQQLHTRQEFQRHQPVIYPTQVGPQFMANAVPSIPRIMLSQAMPYAFRPSYQQPLEYQLPRAPVFNGTSHSNVNRLSYRSPNIVHAALPITQTDISSPVTSRGPPRKPKRSGHAVWCGNIPYGTSIEALKDHFSKDATDDIESVFLMSRSNCAFVNYKTLEACLAAITRFNNSTFGSVRLLCRLRHDRNTFTPSEAQVNPDSKSKPTETARDLTQDDADSIAQQLARVSIGVDESPKDPLAPTEHSSPISTSNLPKSDDRFFVLKSLTRDDLQDSLQRNTWETQPHNQNVLDAAFRSAKNVFLIFSVNKSGEYFGYARMLGPPSEETRSRVATPNVFTSPPRGESAEAVQVIHTAATTTAPEGYIVEDASRGTLFWEAEQSGQKPVNGIDQTVNGTTNQARTHIQTRPFQLEWLSLRRVPFQRTKGMINAWNNNKEIKVARDGTELETAVGRQLIALFHEQYEDIAAKRIRGTAQQNV